MATRSAEFMRDWFADDYSSINASANGSFFERYTHAAMEPPWSHGMAFPNVLEVGANRGEHIPYVHHEFHRYIASDIEPPQLLAEVAADPRIEPLACDIAALPARDQTFDRVVVTCVLHHVESPYDAAFELRRVTRVGGLLTILVPNDPGAAYRWGKALTTGRYARKSGRSRQSALADAIGHHNHYRSIRIQLREAFRDDAVSVRWLPFRVPAVELNAFTVWNIRRLS
ncbi:MAG: class I SAM-dependent methyltransferase [Candidatus Nanopelagicales bacterium]